MREHPILFSAPMVRAILDGRKTQTRRIVKGVDGNSWIRIKGGYGTHVVDEKALAACPYGVPGDRLWVREAWFPVGTWQPRWSEDGALYRADGEAAEARRRELAPGLKRPGWRPSIHMPKWASHILLEVTDVRVERLNDISEEDARAEGVESGVAQNGSINGQPATVWVFNPRKGFALLWDTVNGPGAWNANPWCWAITFKRVAP